MKKLVIRNLAHVDAGKTTLSEGMLYLSGTVRKLGRVDHKDAFLDTYSLERDRGITIFSKQAVFSLGNRRINLLDTPGHVDFSAEMERTLQVLDYAVLVISGADGVQGHTETLWKLLKLYEIPTFIFINKMDQPGTDRESLLTELKERLDEGCIVFGKGKNVESLEEIAMTDEAVLDYFMEHETVRNEDICRLIRERKIFPCYFGSALKLDGVQELLAGFEEYMKPFDGKKEFGARVFKISRDDKGERLTFLKVTGGKLVVKMPINKEEKINQIRIYSGAKYEAVNEVEAGGVCAVTGLSSSYIGQGLGVEKGTAAPFLEPVLTYQMILPEGADTTKVLRELKQLEEEEPLLNIVWNPALEEIHVQLMGEVQTEILKTMIAERFHLDVEFGTGKIVYKETIKSPVVGVGHYEPLRHYAEVHLKMEPLEAGSGLVFDTDCSEDVLDRNWQRLILTHLQEREHPGVLTGAPITDMKITIVAGRAHLKHTEGGDFRQATYRAVRQGLKKAKTVLLEPYYSFRLELPAENVGRAMTDIQRMQGSFQGPETEGELAVITGSAPVAKMRDYQSQVISYTRGKGHLSCTLKGYEPCQDQEQIAQEIGYDSERDLDNPTGSVFCAHGAGFVVPWYEVEEYMHLDGAEIQDWDDAYEESGDSSTGASGRGYSGQGKDTYSTSYGTENNSRGKYTSMYGSYEEEKELKAIFEKTFGPVKSKKYNSNSRSFGNLESGSSFSGNSGKRSQSSELPGKTSQGAWRNSNPAIHRDDYLLVDGCNIIFAWEDLRDLAQADFHAAQTRLMDILSDYQGIKGCILILVFDAYRVEGHPEETFQYHNIHVVYTREAETADQYIERTVHKIGRKHNVTVATSDGLEQIIIMGQGAARISARGFKEEIASANLQMREEWQERRDSSKTYLFDSMTPELKSHMEDIRLGRKKKEEL